MICSNDAINSLGREWGGGWGDAETPRGISELVKLTAIV